MVTVRAYAGSRSDEEPRAVVVGGSDVPVELIEWRAVEERDGERRRVFVCRVGGSRVRLAHIESSSLWEIERILDPPSPVVICPDHRSSSEEVSEDAGVATRARWVPVTRTATCERSPMLPRTRRVAPS